MTHRIGDIVQVETKGTFGPREIPDGLKTNIPYEIVNIHRGIDGAYDWDDIFLKGFGNRKFCEFNLKPYEYRASDDSK